jgi:hypothetical protein
MGRFILPIFFYFFFSCGNTVNTEVNLFDGHVYLLKKGEKEVEKNATAIKEAEELKKIFDKNNLVLYKAITHNYYNTYLFIDLDSTITKTNIYKSKPLGETTLVFHQHMVDSLSEITAITIINNKQSLQRFSNDSLSKGRFIVKELKNE